MMKVEISEELVYRINCVASFIASQFEKLPSSLRMLLYELLHSDDLRLFQEGEKAVAALVRELITKYDTERVPIINSFAFESEKMRLPWGGLPVALFEVLFVKRLVREKGNVVVDLSPWEDWEEYLDRTTFERKQNAGR